MGLDLIPLNFPLGCGPGGGPPSWGVSLAVGYLLLGGGFPWQGGLLGRGSPSQGGLLGKGVPPSWGVSLARGVSFPGGLFPRVGVGVPPSWEGGSIPACTEADPYHHPDTSKNITLATTSLRPVKNAILNSSQRHED